MSNTAESLTLAESRRVLHTFIADAEQATVDNYEDFQRLFDPSVNPVALGLSGLLHHFGEQPYKQAPETSQFSTKYEGWHYFLQDSGQHGSLVLERYRRRMFTARRLRNFIQFSGDKPLQVIEDDGYTVKSHSMQAIAPDFGEPILGKMLEDPTAQGEANASKVLGFASALYGIKEKAPAAMESFTRNSHLLVGKLLEIVESE